MGTAPLAEETRLHPSEALTRATCQIIGGKGSSGTVFFIACEMDSAAYLPVLVTARHVLDSISTDSATIIFRVQTSEGAFQPHPQLVEIRKNGVPKYLVHPDSTIDLAVMVVAIPMQAADVVLPMSRNFIATQAEYRKYWIHLGDEVFFLGYPLGMRSPQGAFPILRSGYISSYPILPLEQNPVLLVDGDVFEGNSGGPVYFEFMASGWNTRYLNQEIKIMGVITTSVAIWESKDSYKEKRSVRHDLHLGGFVNSYFLHQMLDSVVVDWTLVR